MRARRETAFDDDAGSKTWLQAYGPPLLLIVVSLLVIDGCAIVQRLFEAGFGVGVLGALAALAILGSVVAAFVRK